MILLSLILLSCSREDKTVVEDPPVQTPEPEVADTSEQITMDVEEDLSGTIETAPDDRLPGRDRKRMEIAQLRKVIPQVTGGIEWTEGYGYEGDDMLDRFSDTLGVPDYFYVTIEDKDASLIFEKYLGDAARSVCSKLIELEATGTGDGVFLSGVTVEDTWDSNPQAIEANLILQIKRFHGIDYVSGDADLEEWAWLFRTTHLRTGETQKAWRAVCVTLMLHPYFFTY